MSDADRRSFESDHDEGAGRGVVGSPYFFADGNYRAHLAGYKCPRRWEFTDALPRNAVGKLMKTTLPDRSWQSGRVI